MKVSELMNRAVDTCRATDTLDQVARIMWEKDCGVVPVVDQGSRIVGMITDRDICMAGLTQGRPLREIPVSRVMSKQLWACSPEDELARAEEVMQTHQVRRIPVRDEAEHLVGILSLADIAREAAKEEGEKKLRKKVDFAEVGRTLSAINEPRFAAAATAVRAAS